MKKEEKKITIEFNDETESWKMDTIGVTTTETLGILAMFTDNVRYHRLYKIEQYIKNQEDKTSTQ